MLSAENLCKTIGSQEILKDVSLSVLPGEIVAVIGPSGAGKTSLLRALSMIEQPDSGNVSVNGQHVSYPELTVVFQQFFLWPHLTIRQNLTLPLRGNIDEQHFAFLIREFQMETFLDKYPNEVSMGQRQRAAFVRALLLKPKYLLLDEVTSALDIEQSYLILSHLKEIASSGVGIVFVTHALHFARKIADTVIFLDQGSVLESGTPIILNEPKTLRLKKFIQAFAST